MEVRRIRFGDYSSTQQFLATLEEMKQAGQVWYSIYREGGHPHGRIERVFWTYSWSIEMWKQNLELLSMDNTYRVNRFNMPLCQITGVTSLQTTYPVAWCLMSGEKRPLLPGFLSLQRTVDVSTMGGLL